MKVGVVIGRFQPFHNGHLRMVEAALDESDHVVIVVGSTGSRPCFRDPWSFEARRNMIKASVAVEDHYRVSVVEVLDKPYDDGAWESSVFDAVDLALGGDSRTEPGITLFGYHKDETSDYLGDRFKSWERRLVSAPVLIPASPKGLSATWIRELFFGEDHTSRNRDKILQVVSPGTYSQMMNMSIAQFSAICRELDNIREHKKMWQCRAVELFGGPVQTAVDALVETPDEILVIKRGGAVGQGALALPGGFVEPHETLFDAALRELSEETSLLLNRDKFPSNTVGAVTPFDYPLRSMRGRIITNVLHINLDAPEEVRGGDDAAQALWIKKADLESLRDSFFNDHWHIINETLKLNRGVRYQ